MESFVYEKAMVEKDGLLGDAECRGKYRQESPRPSLINGLFEAFTRRGCARDWA